jgi:hypothetical protein
MIAQLIENAIPSHPALISANMNIWTEGDSADSLQLGVGKNRLVLLSLTVPYRRKESAEGSSYT